MSCLDGTQEQYDWMLFLTSPIAFVLAGTHDFLFTRQMLYSVDTRPPTYI